MKIKSVLKEKYAAWASGVLVAGVPASVVVDSSAKASVQPPSSPLVEVATVEQRDVPVYGEWIGTLSGQLHVEKYGPPAKVDAVSKQDFDNVTQTNLTNQAQVQAAQAAIAATKAQIQPSQANP